MPEIAEVWREGCIIRSAMLNDMASALRENSKRNLVLALLFQKLVAENLPGLRKTALAAQSGGLPVPALSAALAYFDTLTTERTTANMLQAQRDYFGSHTYRRTDRDGVFHTEWEE